MVEEAVKEYQFQRGNLLLMPYDPRVPGLFNEEALIAIYKRLKAEDLWDIVFHEDAGVTLLKFMNFFCEGRALLQILAITDAKGYIEPIGVSWVGDITTCAGILTRGIGSFLFFKEYQKPMYTDQFSEMILDYWFNALKLDIIVGVTPEPNRAALIYVKRAGFKECGRIPKYTTFKGEAVTGIITSMTKEDYSQLAGG
jgi:RimJ/RimL family protein N-acetyltransferase